MGNDTTEKIPPDAYESALVGLTIAEVWREGYTEFDDVPFFLMRMTDGTVWRFSGGYGAYTGSSHGEYTQLLDVEKVK